MRVKSLIAAIFAALLLSVSVFALSSMTGTVLKNANLRNGPGTNYGIIGKANAGQVITITEANAAGTWYHLDNKAWIAAFLVKVSTVPKQSGSTTQPVATSTAIPASATATSIPPAPTAIPTQVKQAPNCDPSYPGVCIPNYPPDLDCGDIPYKRFQVVGADLHGFDRDRDGIGCER
jgi:uncharacterized protein YraI